PVKVGTRFPNELGTYDMSGNVWEWCQDRFAPYSSEDSVNPVGPEKTETGLDYRVMRGGSAAAFWDKCRTANRSENKASLFKSTIGFRLAL
ncbi:MAG: SUMF1/EgtB/PvdO family nonheme iron enzyme, partial [Bacteroidales bacterium]|nr:SUMF1/EgtB/PvdO family nonheme iron enzyme [Bacteroidales bacterium]